MNKPKIVIAAEIFPPDIGGPATYTVKLAQALISRGWDVDVVCYSDQEQPDNYSFKIHRVIRKPFKFHYFNYYKILKNLATDVDVIYAMGPVSSGRPALKVAKQLNKKLVVKVVGDYAWEQAQGFGKTSLLLDAFQKKTFSGKIGMIQRVERQVCQQANHVIVPSQYLKNVVSGWGVNANNITVVYNSVDLSGVPRQKDTKEDLIISIARLVPWKGMSLLVEVMSELIQVNPKFRLLILGSGPEKDYLESKIKGLNLFDKIKIELVDHQTRDSYLSRAEIFVLNTGYEGLSHTILEAFAAQIPVITTNIGGNPELITDEETGLMIEYNNKEQIKESILRLHHDSELRQRLAVNAKEKLKDFTFTKMIEDTINVLEL